MNDGIEQLSEEHREELKKMGPLLAAISNEFEGWQIKAVESDPEIKGVEVTAEFFSLEKKLTFLGVQTATRTLLSRTTEVEFQYRIPNTQPGDAEIHWGHTGSFNRTGIRGKVKRGGAQAQTVADALSADNLFDDAFFPLDSKHFYLIQDDQGWQVKTSQMGAAWLAIKFPPTKRYIQMGAAQIECLINSFQALDKFFKTSN